MDLEDRIAAVNFQLSKVRLRQKSNNFYLRAQLPVPPSQGIGKRRFELPTGCRATVSGLAIAKLKAHELERQILMDQFSWEGWGKTPEPPVQVVTDRIAVFEQSHFEGKTRSCNSLDIYRQDYGRFFDWLPQDQVLTLELLKTVLEARSEADSRTRFHCCRAYKALANSAGLDPSTLLSKLQGTYSGKSIRSKDIPSNELILGIWKTIKSPHWQWAYGMMACFGIRNHELFFLDTSRMSEPECWLQVEQATKTGYRLVRPYPEEWVELMDLRNPKPLKNNTEGKTHRDLGRYVSGAFYSLKIPFTPYALRHAYAVRLAVEGLSEAIAARMMGHSIAVHCRHYHAFLNERHINEAFKRLKER